MVGGGSMFIPAKANLIASLRIENPNAAVAVVKLKAQLTGHFVEKRETTEVIAERW